MSETNRRSSSNDAMDKIIGDMSSDILTNDGQYMPLGYPSQQNVAETLSWATQSPPSRYLNYGLHYQEPTLNQGCDFIHQGASIFETPVMFPKNINLPEFNGYNLRSNSAPQTLYNGYPQSVIAEDIAPEPLIPNQTHSPVFDNLVGSWTLPNTTGTYTPFGSPDTFKPNLFEFQAQNGETMEKENKFKQSEYSSDKFQFRDDLKKTRPLAEVKPMRPSYSDVLTKPVPATTNSKPIKTESKDMKLKNKESRKNGKIDKTVKAATLLNRNCNNDFKDLQIDRPLSHIKMEKRNVKPNQLNRKWNSLDNIAEQSAAKVEEPKRKKVTDDVYSSKPINKTKTKANKSVGNFSEDVSDENVKIESVNINKNSAKKNKSTGRQKQADGSFGTSERPSSKRNQRIRKRDSPGFIDILSEKVKLYTKGWWKMFTILALWFLHLISDVCSLSVHVGHEFVLQSWAHLVMFWKSLTSTSEAILKRWRLTAWVWEKFEQRFKKKTSKPSKFEEETSSFLQNGLDNNISMPTTGDEAMKRLLACKGKDPYSILGVTPKCTDDDIKKYYKRQAFLVHPDKNNQPGAEEAFKILVHAFDMIGTPERRTIYDRGVAESAFVVQNFSQMAELLQQLQQKMEMNANTIRCSACGDRHKRIKMDRPSYAARNCKTCKIHHAAREGDIWAEAKCFGFLWHYYACMEGSVYDISDWACCQKETLKHLKPDTHQVQYRIALGKQNSSQPRRNSQAPRMDKPDLENLLNSLYGHNDSGISRRKNKNRK